MKKEKLVSLNKYLAELKSRLASDVPEKHKHRPNEYKELLQREIFKVNKTIELDKLEGSK